MFTRTTVTVSDSYYLFRSGGLFGFANIETRSSFRSVFVSVCPYSSFFLRVLTFREASFCPRMVLVFIHAACPNTLTQRQQVCLRSVIDFVYARCVILLTSKLATMIYTYIYPPKGYIYVWYHSAKKNRVKWAVLSMKETEYNPHCSRINEEALLFCFGIKTVVRDGNKLAHHGNKCVCDGNKMARHMPFCSHHMPRLFCIIVYQEAAKNAIFTG